MLSLLLLAGAGCRYAADLVYTQLITELPYRHEIYSGMLHAGVNKSFHYVLFLSQNKPALDPLMLWLNGGPGCSSMLGAFTQHGPFKFKENSTEMELNPYAWNRNASVLYLESPGGVGFSVGPVKSDDQSVSEDNLEALLSFFVKFPELQKQDFYIAGESYGGIYVPYLAMRVHDYNTDVAGPDNDRIRLQGIMVGNACTHPRECYEPGVAGNSFFVYGYLYQRFYYSDEEWSKFRASCSFDYNSETCLAQQDDLWGKFNRTETSLYDLYGKCYHQQGNASLLKDDLGCEDMIGVNTLLNTLLVKRALHVDTDTVWEGCSDDVSSNYTMDKDSTYWMYPLLMRHYRVLVYSGDADACVPVTGTLYWMKLLQEEQRLTVTEPWKTWRYKRIVGGSTFKLGNNLTFASVRKAGHMVPSTQPELALHLLGHFLSHHPLDRPST